MTYQSISLQTRGAVAVISLDRPAQLNAFNEQMFRELLDAMATVRDQRGFRALLLTANGKLFSAGAELGELLGENSHGLGRGDNVARMMHGLFNKAVAELHEFPVPVVIALNGGVAGGAVGLALAGDVMVAARSAYFYLPFVPKLGLIPDLGATWFLQRMLGRTRALALTVTGGRWSAHQAEQWGMLHAVFDDQHLFEEALRLAEQLARLPAYGVIEARRALDHAGRQDLRGQLAYEAYRQNELLDLDTFEEGVNAFFAKRDAVFPGR